MRLPPRRARLALACSVLLHLVLAVFLARHRDAPPPPRAEAPLVIEIRESTKPAPKATQPGSTAAPKVHATRPSTPLGANASNVVVHTPSPPQPEVPAAPPSTRAPDLADAATHAADRVAQNSLALEPPKPPPAEEDRSIQAPYVNPDVNERVNGMISERLGTDRVERGMYDPYFKDLRLKLATQWNAEKKVDEKGLSGFLDEAGRGLRDGAAEWMRDWQASAERYGASGNPMLEDPFDAEGRLRENIPHGVTELNLNQLRSTRIALIRITQKLDGSLLRVELVQPSIDAAMDAEILRELRLGEMVLPVPPKSGLGIHNPIRSVWAFQLSVSISPPAPMVQGAFDVDWFFDRHTREEMGLPLDMRLPLSRKIEKHVELISVE